MARRIVEHAGRTVWVELMDASLDISRPMSVQRDSKVMIVMLADTPTGSFSIPLPVEKAKGLADLLRCAADEISVKKIMDE
jgi:preprotein translocase subunit SecD